MAKSSERPMANDFIVLHLVRSKAEFLIRVSSIKSAKGGQLYFGSVCTWLYHDDGMTEVEETPSTIAWLMQAGPGALMVDTLKGEVK